MAAILPTKTQSVEASLPPASWQTALKRSIRSGHQLCQHLRIAPSVASDAAEQDFPVFAPLEFVARMAPEDPRDPLLLQILARQQELDSGGLADPVGDLDSQKTDGLLHKYSRRVLLVASGACAIHCRYCFRRHFPYSSIDKGRQTWQKWLDAISSDESIDEVILSGGDPLSVADSTLHWFVEELNAIPHVQRLRIHTRFPVVIPQRVCRALMDWIQVSNQAVYFVLHVNHANEIDEAVLSAAEELRASGVTLLNQAVLLAGVNDSLQAQLDLCLRLVDNQILPYYLHQLDPVAGAMHFEVDDETARKIVAELQASLPGYAVPKLVREIAGCKSKTPV